MIKQIDLSNDQVDFFCVKSQTDLDEYHTHLPTYSMLLPHFHKSLNYHYILLYWLLEQCFSQGIFFLPNQEIAGGPTFQMQTPVIGMHSSIVCLQRYELHFFLCMYSSLHSNDSSPRVLAWALRKQTTS